MNSDDFVSLIFVDFSSTFMLPLNLIIAPKQPLFFCFVSCSQLPLRIIFFSLSKLAPLVVIPKPHP